MAIEPGEWGYAADFDEAVQMINGSRYGNAASLFTNSGKHAREFKYRVRADASPRYPRIGWDRPKASDHCPVVMDLRF